MESYWRHKYLSECNPKNKERFEFSVVKDDENFVRPKCSKKIKNNIKIMKSSDFIQNFRLFRDFSYDRKPLSHEKVKKIDIVAERREKLKLMTTARKTNDIPSELLDAIANSVYGEPPNVSETINFAK